MLGGLLQPMHLLVLLGSAFLVFGLKQLFGTIRDVASTKARFETAVDAYRSQFTNELGPDHGDRSQGQSMQVAGRP